MEEQQEEDSVCVSGAGGMCVCVGWGESLFCSLLSRETAGEFQRASRDSQVNTTLPGSCQGWPQTLPTWREAWQHCQGAILHLPPIPIRWTRHRKGHLKGSSDCLALPTQTPPPLPLPLSPFSCHCSPGAGYPLLWNPAPLSVNLIVTQLPSPITCLPTISCSCIKL